MVGNLSFLSLAGPAWLAGVLTFLAPCTLPLVPGYLAFISGVSFDQLNSRVLSINLKLKVLINGLWYVAGFTFVFAVLGSLFGWGGALLAGHRLLLARWGGLLIILFGLFILGGDKWSWFNSLTIGHKASWFYYLRPGRPLSALLLGVIFALGWTPCIGPVLGTVLLLASSSGTAVSGAALLLIFSAGLALPFLLVAWSLGWFMENFKKWSGALKWFSRIGGWFLIGLGLIMFLDKFGWWSSWIYKCLNGIDYQHLLNYL